MVIEALLLACQRQSVLVLLREECKVIWLCVPSSPIGELIDV